MDISALSAYCNQSKRKTLKEIDALQGSEDEETKLSVAEWTVSEVCAWLDSRPLGAHGGPLLEAASNHAISGKALLRLTEKSMERMGIVPQSLRQQLLHEVLCLRIQQEMEDLLDITDGEDLLYWGPNWADPKLPYASFFVSIPYPLKVILKSKLEHRSHQRNK